MIIIIFRSVTIHFNVILTGAPRLVLQYIRD